MPGTQGREGPARQGGQVWATRRFFREGSSELDFLGEKRMATVTTMVIANDTERFLWAEHVQILIYLRLRMAP